MKLINRFPGLILAVIVALFLTGQAAAHAGGSLHEDLWVTEDWILEYMEDAGKGPASERTGQYTVVFFNIIMDQGQSYGGSLFEYHKFIEHRSRAHVKDAPAVSGGLAVSTLGLQGSLYLGQR